MLTMLKMTEFNCTKLINDNGYDWYCNGTLDLAKTHAAGEVENFDNENVLIQILPWSTRCIVLLLSFSVKILRLAETIIACRNLKNVATETDESKLKGFFKVCRVKIYYCAGNRRHTELWAHDSTDELKINRRFYLPYSTGVSIHGTYRTYVMVQYWTLRVPRVRENKWYAWISAPLLIFIMMYLLIISFFKPSIIKTTSIMILYRRYQKKFEIQSTQTTSFSISIYRYTIPLAVVSLS